MHSCLYVGQVRHRRHLPKSHGFNYRVFYVYLDLDELDSVFHKRWFWSTRRFNLAWFRRKDHLGETHIPLKQAVLDAVDQHLGIRPQGPIRLLTHLRYFGYGFNPVSFYYCLDREGTKIEAIVAEVNNTPWGEQYLYVVQPEQALSNQKHMQFSLHKEFHVSPFMPMELDYRWNLSKPEQHLSVHMENYQAGKKLFDATLSLKQQPITGTNCARVLLQHPFMTLKVITTIYWQAIKLLIKGIPVFDHPHKHKTVKRGADRANEA